MLLEQQFSESTLDSVKQVSYSTNESSSFRQFHHGSFGLVLVVVEVSSYQYPMSDHYVTLEKNQ